MFTPLQLPRSWFKVTKHNCIRRHKNNNNNGEAEEEESYFQIKGRIFTAPQAIWFHSNFADRHCIPLLLPTQINASSVLPVCSDLEFDQINQQIGIVESTGTLTQLPCEYKIEPLSTRKGSFYIAHNQLMLCVQLGNGALTYFGLSEAEHHTLLELNESSVLKDAFFLQVALGLLDKQATMQSSVLHALMTTAGQTSDSSSKRSTLLPADNEVFHFGLLRKHNKKFGLSAKHVFLALGRIVLVSIAEASSGHASIKASDLFRARCRCTGEKSFECQLALAASSLLFTCEDKAERDLWMHKIQVCALFSVNQPRNNGSILLLPQCTTMPQVMRFEAQTILVENLLECLGRPRGEIDANMRQSTLDFERDRVIVNGREVLPCLLSNLILTLVKELNANAAAAVVDEETKLEFVRMILLVATRTQCGGLIYECLQQVFRSTEDMKDRLMISPRSEHVPAIEITVTKATPDLLSPAPSTNNHDHHMAALKGSLEALHLPPSALDSATSTPTSATTPSPATATATLPPVNSMKSAAVDLLPSSMKRTHRRSASDPQFFKKMLQKQTSSSASTTTPTTTTTAAASPQVTVQTPPQPPITVPESPRASTTPYHHPFASRLPPPPASASAYFKHNRTFSLQKKNHQTLDVEFHQLDSVPLGAICAKMHAEMDFVIRDCDTNEKLIVVRAKYARSFYLVERRALAKDQGQISLEMLALEDKDVAPPAAAVQVEEANMRSMVTDVTDEDYRSVVFLSEDEGGGGSFTRRSQFEEDEDEDDEEEVHPYVM